MAWAEVRARSGGGYAGACVACADAADEADNHDRAHRQPLQYKQHPQRQPSANTGQTCSLYQNKIAVGSII